MDAAVKKGPYRPFPIKLINAAGKTLHKIGLDYPSLKENKLLKAAQKATKLQDFGDEHFREGLQRLLVALEQEAALNFIGKISAQHTLHHSLCTRLRLVEYQKQHPEVAQENIEKPIFIIGLPRTGTTILQALMSQDPNNRSPLSWEASRPLPPPQPESYTNNPRVAEVQKELDQLIKMAPGFLAVHDMGATAPQECLVFMAYEFKSLQFFSQFRIPSYQTWLDDEADMYPSYQAHKRFLQILQSGGVSSPRWLLKSPFHLGYLKEILRVYPEARFIHTHREPSEVIASASSLFALTRQIGSEQVDLKEIAQHQMTWWAKILNKAIEQRKSIEDEAKRFYDLPMADLVQDPVGGVKKIYQHFELPFSSELKNKMDTFMQANPRGKHGKHLYQAEDFGINAQEAQKLFQNYRDYFNL